MDLTAEKLAKYFDHTQLKAFAQEKDLEALCVGASKYRFAAIAINGCHVPLCKELLAGSGVHVGATAGFPLGQMTVESKVFETQDTIAKGADEIDYVVNIGKLKDGNIAYVEDEMRRIVGECKEKNVVSKVIFENCYLTDDEKKTMCEIALRTKIDYIKTSTGFGTGGATLDDIKLMKAMVGDEIKIKAAGGIRDIETALQYIDLGVDRIGCSASAAIVEAFKEQ